MDILYIVLTVVLILACICMITAILLQKKRDGGFSASAMTGQSNEEKSHFDKTKSRTFEGKLERWTKILATVFMLLSLAISLVA